MTVLAGPQTNPIAEHELFRTTDPVQAQESKVAALVTTPHRLRLHGRAADFDAAVHAVRVGPTWLCIMRYRTELTIDRPAYHGCLSVVVPLTGRLTLVRGNEEYVARPNQSMANCIGDGVAVLP
jgi:hypothetical protein